MPKNRSASPKSIECIARGVLRRGSSILLCQNTKDGYYYLPGGHIEPGETAEEAVCREFMEEARLPVRTEGVGQVCEVMFRTGKASHHEINVVFHVAPKVKDVIENEIPSAEPGIAFVWVDMAAIVDLDVRPAAQRAWLVSDAFSQTGGVVWTSQPDEVA